MRDRQPRLALADVGRDGEGQELAEVVEEATGDRLIEDERADRVGQPGERPQLGVVVRVLHEPDVEDEVRFERHPELEPEADELECQLIGPDIGRRAANRRSRSWRRERSDVSRTTSESALTESSRRRSSAIELAMPAFLAERVTMARLAVAPDQDLVARLEEDDARADPAALERAAHGRQGERRIAGADVEHDRDPGEPGAVRGRRARPGPAGARRAGCRRRCSRGPRTVSRPRSCRHPTAR